MSTIQDVSAEQLAKVFHHYWDALAHDSEANQGAAAHISADYRSTEESSTEDSSTEDGSADNRAACCSWDRTPPSDRKLLVAAARLALLELSTTPIEAPRRKYYATPGKAEWGS